MNIIETLNTDYNQYIKHCFDGLKASVSVFDIDNSKGETDLTRLLFVDKKHLNKQQAMAFLTMRLNMYEEEWTDYEAYTKEDVKRCVGFLERNYEHSTYYSEVSHDEFINDHFVFKLQFKEYNNSIHLNNQFIDYEMFRPFFPTENEILTIAKTSFKRLEQEYYLETGSHFVLINWYTTA